MRTVSAKDLEFQWIRKDKKVDIDLTVNKRFNFDKIAYVRRLDIQIGEDPRFCTGIFSFGPRHFNCGRNKDQSMKSSPMTREDLPRHNPIPKNESEIYNNSARKNFRFSKVRREKVDIW